MISTKPVYSLLESLTFGKGMYKTISDVKVKLPARYIRYFPGNFEKENFDFMKTCCGEGATIIDIGAHIGLFSLIAAKTAGAYGKVFAFEPSPTTIPALLQTIRINELGNFIHPVYQAMGKEVCKSNFYISDDEADNGNSLVCYKQDRKLHTVQVDVNTIDNFVLSKKLSKISLINIDVEGAEYDTLVGGMEVLKKYKPNIILAIHPEPIEKKGDTLEDIYDLLDKLKYNINTKDGYISREAFCSNKELICLHLSPR